MQLLRHNFSTHIILAGWPLSVALVISILWGKESYLDYALVANAGYLLASLLDWGGVNARVVLNKIENIENVWLNKAILFSFLSIIVGVIFSKLEIVLFAVAAFTNPQWIYVANNEQKKYNRVLFWSRIAIMFTFFSQNFLILLPISLIVINVVLIVITNHKLRISKYSEVKQYFVHGFTFFLSKLSTSLWMYLPLLIISRFSTYEYVAYADKFYQMIVASSVPIVLTQLKGQLNLSIKRFSFLGRFLSLFFIIISVFIWLFNLDFAILYFMFGTALFFLAVFGQGWIKEPRLRMLNITYAISTLIILLLSYIIPHLLLLYPIFFIINIYARIRLH